MSIRRSPPEYVSSIRGVLSAKAGTHPCIVVLSPASQLRKGRQDVREPVGIVSVYYMIEQVFDRAVKEIT